MSIQLINTLIDKNDTFEVVRDQIAMLLKTNVAEQMVLAAAALKDPALWDLRIFLERANPFEEFLQDEPANTSPIVNIWYDTQGFDRRKGNVTNRQQSDTTFNIDVYGYGVSASDGTGHKAGDKVSALEAQRGVRLVRNILMADINTYLQLPRGNVEGGGFAGRWIDNIQSFQPEIDERPVANVRALRISFSTSFNEFSPQQVNAILTSIGLAVYRKETGEIYFTKEIDLT